MHKLFLALGLCASVSAFAGCPSGTYGLGVHGSSTQIDPISVTVVAGSYNWTTPVSTNQYQEFCWASSNGYGRVTKVENGITYQYNWSVPDNGSYYKEIWIDETNWTAK